MNSFSFQVSERENKHSDNFEKEYQLPEMMTGIKRLDLNN